jgi:AcrR family transcriptional regulator
MATSPTGRPQRRHAIANRERILAAAETVFGARGAQGSTEEVADRAGVGIATVFRHFPTKQALVEAALLRHFQRLRAQADGLGQDGDPGQALRQLLTTMIATGATKLTLASLVTDGGELPRGLRAAAGELRGSMDVILTRAREAGVTREDITIDEVYLLIRGLAHALAAMPAPAATLDAAIDVIWRGIAVGAGA